jgi:ubiquinone/menaquinone biosynthesis C-methylase UbiE
MNPNLMTFASEKYAKNVENHPYHRFYNHPALLSLLPSLSDKHVLDVGCGTGFFAEHFVKQGARVTALDITLQMVDRTKARVPQATVLQADLANDLPFENQSFDLVFSSLTLQYLEDWQHVFSEFARVLKAKSQVLFSVHHSFAEFKTSGQDYFVIEKREREGGAGKQVSYRRSISSILESLHQARFVLESLLEPVPVAAYAQADPEGYLELCQSPGLLVILAQKKMIGKS